MTKPAAIFSVISSPHGAALVQESQGVVQCCGNMGIYFQFSVRMISVKDTQTFLRVTYIRDVQVGCVTYVYLLLQRAIYINIAQRSIMFIMVKTLQVMNIYTFICMVTHSTVTKYCMLTHTKIYMYVSAEHIIKLTKITCGHCII